jgi:hypothetical protein
MITPSSNNQQTSVSVENMQIKIPDSFQVGRSYIPIGKQTTVNGRSIPAIPEFQEAPTGGTYVLGAVNGVIQWLATEACD